MMLVEEEKCSPNYKIGFFFVYLHRKYFHSLLKVYIRDVCSLFAIIYKNKMFIYKRKQELIKRESR
jgi:hypothetical protein